MRLSHVCVLACLLLGLNGALSAAPRPIVEVAAPDIRGLPKSMLAAPLSSGALPGVPLSPKAFDFEGPQSQQPDPADNDPKFPRVMDAQPLSGDSGSSSSSASLSALTSGLSSLSASLASMSGSSSSHPLSGSSSGSSFGGSSSSGSSSSGSSSGSSSQSAHSRCRGGGPCGGGGPLQLAKIVKSLGGSKNYRAVGKDIWSFSAANGAAPKEDLAEELEAETAARDPELARMKLQLKSLKEKLANEQIWIEDVKTIVQHYKQKVGAVQLSMKTDAHHLQELKAMIVARRKLGARRALEEKLTKVHAQLQKLQSAAQDVSGEAKSLGALRTNLNRSIGTIQREIEKLRAQDHH